MELRKGVRLHHWNSSCLKLNLHVRGMTWMRLHCFRTGQKVCGVRWGEEISMDNLEDWLTLDMRVVSKWLAGETQVITTAEATPNAAKRTTEVRPGPGFVRQQIGLFACDGLRLHR